MEAVIWLENYLQGWDRILLLVSHSQDFLNNVCTHMIDFTNRKKLLYYDGNYDQYIKTKREKEENQWKQYKWEQEQIKSMKEYIARFGHGTAKNAKQAQSKEKVLAKMIRAGLTEKPEEEKAINFKFTDPGHLPPPVLAFHDVSFGYPNCEPLYTNVNFGVDLDSRVALVGPNGAGKTTLIKLMAGELAPSMGDIRPHGHLKLGRFTQHFVDVLDLELSPLEFFESHYPNDPQDDLRKYLGRFGLSGRMQVQKMAELSDGQKTRVVFAKLGRDVPHILLLDEPTNHLDINGIDALAKAINEFEGGMVLVSHDMRLISQVAKEIWICDHKTITKFPGDILSFKKHMRQQLGLDDDAAAPVLRGDASVQKTNNNNNNNKTMSDSSAADAENTQNNNNHNRGETTNNNNNNNNNRKSVIAGKGTQGQTPAAPPKTMTREVELPTTTKAAVVSPPPPPPQVVSQSSSSHNDDKSKSGNDNWTNGEKQGAGAMAPTTTLASTTITAPAASKVEVASTTLAVASTTTTTTTVPPATRGKYVPPHLRRKMAQEQQQQ